MQRHFLASLVLATGLAAISAGAAKAADAQHGAQVFKRCSACHAADTPTNKIGPSLKGIWGRTAGSLAGYRYSPALQDAGKAGLVWDDVSLAEYIVSPRKKVPGTRMSFAGMSNEADVADVIEYLRQFP